MTRTRRQLAHCVAATFALAGSAAFAQSNGGFEAPALANGVFNYGPSGAGDHDQGTGVDCVASNGAWNGVPSQLPDPLVISGVEWAIENVQAPPAYHGDWPPAHNALGIYDTRIQ